MAVLHLSEHEIVERAALLPAFPTVVNDLLQTLDDDNATLGALIHLVSLDPVITARVLSLANAVAMGRNRDLRDLQVAVSLIGLARVREIVLAVALAEFSRASRMGIHFWEHCVAVGVSAQELARIGHASQDFSLVCGLLHDIGQLWMSRCHPLEYQMVRMSMENDAALDIITAERRYFGTDHCQIGSVLATAWRLPRPVIEAIRHHHAAQPPADKLVAITHVAEAIANALGLSSHGQVRVRHLSDSACQLIGIDWNEDLGFLFGRIEARSRYLTRIFH